MRCTLSRDDVTQVVFAYVIAGAIWLMGVAMEAPKVKDFTLTTSTKSPLLEVYTTQHPPEGKNTCCSGVLGYASDKKRRNFPCHDRPCCNSSDTVAVVAIDFAMGFQFLCMPRRSIQPLCYETGTEVRTTNQDPDFIPRTCCQGLKFKVVLNQWYAAMVIKCVDQQDDDDEEEEEEDSPS